MTWTRRFDFDPGNEVLLNIEAVNILDLEPPEPIAGVGSGMCLLVAEFEDGPFETPTQMLSASDLKKIFGDFGYTYGGTGGNNPCARSRKADSAVAAEFWNGNGHVYLSGKTFAQLTLCRVDTSVGEVVFYRLASLLGQPKVAYSLIDGQTLDIDLDGAGAVTATFNGSAAVKTGTSSALGTITAGETVTLGYDAAADFQVTFLAGDTAIAPVVARINQYAGFTFASDASGEVRLTGRQAGTGGEVRVVGGSTGLVAKLGLTVSSAAGTGNVANIAAVTVEEMDSVVSGDVPGANVEALADGTPRLVNTDTTDGTGTIQLDSTSTATDFGFPTDELVDAATDGTAGVIPAGTRVGDGASQHLVTMVSLAVTAGNAGPYTAKVRHALDDGTGVSSLAAAIDELEAPIELDAFAVSNPVGIGAALTEAQVDGKYEDAFDKTRSINNVGKVVNMAYSARQSNSVRRKGRQNAIDASAGGCRGRVFVARPPLGTPPSMAMGAAEPGIGPYRHKRLVYTFPGVATKVRRIADRGTAGGAGFTADGVVDVGSDGFLCSIMSQLPPEENPGQQTAFLGAVLSLESSPNAQDYDINTYIAFKAAGICAPIIEDGIAGFQSGVTSVDPSQHPAQAPIATRRMADFIQDSLANAG
jgi:hypothetical protein